jgi:DNA-binding response OmpR family regulator
LVRTRPCAETAGENPLVVGDLVINEATYSARLRDRPLTLTYTEFDLLKYLAHHPGQVFSRVQLLHEVWGYDFLGGIRTVDVHIRRLRAKLGAEHKHLIGTVHNVGYTFPSPDRATTRSAVAHKGADTNNPDADDDTHPHDQAPDTA